MTQLNQYLSIKWPILVLVNLNSKLVIRLMIKLNVYSTIGCESVLGDDP